MIRGASTASAKLPVRSPSFSQMRSARLAKGATATSTSAELQTGAIIVYPYLWRWQRERGETEGRKDRPVCVVLKVHGADGLTHLALLAISSQPPAAGRVAIEVPDIERRRGGLSDLKRAWVIVDEYNYDIAQRSFYLETDRPALGCFSRSFMMKLAGKAKVLFQRRQARIDRLD